VAYCLHAAWRLGYINDNELADLEKDLNGVGAPLSGLVRHERSSMNSASFVVFLAIALWIFVLS